MHVAQVEYSDKLGQTSDLLCQASELSEASDPDAAEFEDAVESMSEQQV